MARLLEVLRTWMIEMVSPLQLHHLIKCTSYPEKQKGKKDHVSGKNRELGTNGMIIQYPTEHGNVKLNTNKNAYLNN